MFDEVVLRSDPHHRVSERFASVASVYRELRLFYERVRNGSLAAQMYFGEMEMRRLGSAETEFGRRFGSVVALYGLFAGYGQRPLFTIAWIVAVWLGFSAIYYSLPYVSVSEAMGVSFLVMTFVGRSTADMIIANYFNGVPLGYSVLEIIQMLLSASLIGLLFVSIWQQVRKSV